MQPAASLPKATHFDPALLAEIADQIPQEVEMHKYDIVLKFPSPEQEVELEDYPIFLDKVLKFKYENEPNLDNFLNYLEFLMSSMRYEEAIRISISYKGDPTIKTKEYLAYAYLMTYQLSKYDSLINEMNQKGDIFSIDLVARGEKIYGNIHSFRTLNKKNTEFDECLLEIHAERYAYLSTKYRSQKIDIENPLFWVIWLAHYKADDKEAADELLDTLVQTVDIPDELYREIIEALIEVEDISPEMMIMAEDLYQNDPANPLVLRLNAVWNHRLNNIHQRDLYIERLKLLAETYPEEQLQIEACIVYKQIGDIQKFKLLAKKVVPSGIDLNSLSPKSMFICDYIRDLNTMCLTPVDPNQAISPLYQIAFIEQALSRNQEITDKLKETMYDLIKKYPRYNKVLEVAILFHIETDQYQKAMENIQRLLANRGPDRDIFSFLDKLTGHVDAKEIVKCISEIDNLYGHIPYIAVETLNLLLKLKKYDRFLSQFIKRRKNLGLISQNKFKNEIIARLDQFKNLEEVPLHIFFIEVIIWRAKKLKDVRDIEFLSKAAPEEPEVKKMVGILHLKSDLADAPFETLLAAAPHITEAQEILRCMRNRSTGDWILIYRSINKKLREEAEILERAFEAYFKEGKYAEAAEIGKNTNRFGLEKAKCQFHLGKKSLALAFVKAYLKTNPEDREAILFKKELEGQNPSPSPVFVIDSTDKKDRRKKSEKPSNWEVGFNFSNEKPDYDPYYDPYSVRHIKERLARMQKEEARMVQAPQAAAPAEVKQTPAPKPPVVSEIVKLSVGSTSPSPTQATTGVIKILSRPVDLSQIAARTTPPMPIERISPTPIITSLPTIKSEENQRSITQIMNLLAQTYDFIEMIRTNPKLYSNEFVIYNLVYAFVKTLKPLEQLLTGCDLYPEIAKQIQTKLSDLDKVSCLTSDKLIKFFEYTRSFNLIQKLKKLDEDPTSLKDFGIQFFSIIDRQKEAALNTKNAYERGKEGLILMSELIKAINYHFIDYKKDDLISKKAEQAGAMKGALLLFLKTLENLPLNISVKAELMEKFSFYKVLASRIFTNFSCDISTIMRITTVSFSEISDLELDYLNDISVADFRWVKNNTERLLN